MNLADKIDELSKSLNAVRNATLASVQASGQVVEELRRFSAAWQSSPNPLERLASRQPIVTLIVTVSLPAVIASLVTLLWVGRL